MLSDLKKIEHKIGDRFYHFTCAPDSPLVEVKEALSQFIGYIVSMENNIKNSPPPSVPTESTSTVEEPPKE